MVTLPALSKETQHVNLCDQNSDYSKQYFD